MGVIIRESIKSSVVNYIGVVIGTINVLFIYNKLLSSNEFGLYAILISFPVIGAGLINLGIPNICVRFFNRFADTQKKYSGIFTFLLLAPLLGFIFFLIVFYGLSDVFDSLYSKSPLLIKYAWVLPILTLAILYQGVLEAYCRVHFKFIVPLIIREIFLKISNSILVVAYYFDYLTLTQMVAGLGLVYILAIVFLLLYIKYIGRFYFVWDSSFINSPFFPEMVKYGLWNMAGGAAAAALPHLEKMILPIFQDGLTHTAIFTIALNIALVISIPRNTIASVSEPILARAWSNNDLKDVGNVYRKSALNLSIIGFFLFLGVWVNIDSIFAIIPNSEVNSSGKYVVLLIGLSNVFDMATGLNSEVLRNSPYFKADFVAFIIRFVVLTIANLILIPIYSYNGAAMAILVSTVLYNLAKYVFIWYKLKIQPFSANSLKVVLLAAIAYFATSFINWEAQNDLFQNILKIAVKGSLIVLLFGGGVLALNLSPDLNNTLKQLYRKVK